LARSDDFVGVVVHADQVVAHREVTDDDGVVHQFEEDLAGEAVQGGPVMLSWRDVRLTGRSGSGAYNVVIHEFAHVLDMHGDVAGCRPVRLIDGTMAPWHDAMSRSFLDFHSRIDAGLTSVLDAYGAESESEFFAVSSEAFFVQPWDLQQELPDLYAMLKRFYKQDPAAEQPDRIQRA
jgi:Mlc titration factor MtfA (ptsG expression regulator)